MMDSHHFLNGKPLVEAKPCWGVNRAFFFGESIFSTMKVVKEKVLFKEDHLKRLCEQYFAFYHPKKQGLSYEDLRQVLEEDLGKLRLGDEQKLRLTLFHDQEDFSFEKIQRLVSLEPIKQKKQDLRLKTYFIETKEFRALKVGNYSTLFFERRKLGSEWNDLCLKTEEEEILETVTSNIFFCDRDKIIFPHYRKQFLKGITQEHLKLALAGAFDVVSQKVLTKDLSQMTGAFLCNSLHHIIPVKQIDKIHFNNSCFDQISAIWSEYVQKRV